jgi:hypothetical protein
MVSSERRRSWTSVQLLLPFIGYAAGWSRHGLVAGVMPRRSQDGAVVDVFIGLVVPEPVLARLVALDNRMLRISGVVTGMLRWRRVAATDMTAVRTAAEVEPPASRSEALDAA